MHLDVATLMAAGAFTTGMSSLLLVLAWLADRRALTFLWWSAGNLLIAAGILLLFLFAGEPGGLGNVAAAIALAIGPTFLWTATRTFQGRRPQFLAMAAGPACLIAASLVTHDAALNMGASLFLSAVYFAAAGAELVRRRTARLRARWLLLAFIAIHAALFVAGSVEAAASFLPATGLIPFGIVFSAVHFEQLIFALGSSIFLVAMVREESEQRHKTAARVDMLTGVASRRAFFESAGPALSACAAEHVPMSLVIFDLDRFKQVNDTFGHAVGDHVLNLFGQTAMARLRRSDIMGRLGGEEFAVAMPGVSPEAAYVMADRIRAAFANLALVLNGRPVPTLVSGGVAGSGEGIDLDRLIEKADTALYLAKHLGGNRIEIGREAEPAAAVIRVA